MLCASLGLGSIVSMMVGFSFYPDPVNTQTAVPKTPLDVPKNARGSASSLPPRTWCISTPAPAEGLSQVAAASDIAPSPKKWSIVDSRGRTRDLRESSGTGLISHVRSPAGLRLGVKDRVNLVKSCHQPYGFGWKNMI